METTKTKKMSVMFFIAALGGLLALNGVPDNGFQAMMDNELIRSIKNKLLSYSTHSPEDRLYIQTDKPFYSPGEDIWISVLIRDGQSLKASEQSDIVSVELISPKGTVEKKINLICKNGRSGGDFHLEQEALGGLYKIRAYTQWMKNEGAQNYFEKEIQIQEIVLPNLKMKLDFEKKAFGAGDEVVAKLELNSNENKPLTHHDLKFVGTLNGLKLIEQAGKTDEEGLCYIKFKLPSKLSSNDGLVNVMIDYNGSTESISRSIPIVLNKLKVVLFPEGGDLVNGIESKVAFKVVNEFGKPADVEGIVWSEKGTQLTTFKSFHQGMGAFYIVPQAGEKYHVKITKPAGIDELYSLPEAFERGYVLAVNNRVSGQIGVCIQSTETEELSLVAQVRGKLVYSTVIHSMEGKNEFTFSTEKFPMGVAQITLFDSKGIARAERLTFVNNNKHLNISVETDKAKYLPREKIKLRLTVKDERGLPSPANLAVSVVNDQLLAFANDKSGTILSQLLLQQDLKEKIEEPAFYFDAKEKKADEALDYLLLTSGWRRFTWEKLIEEELPTNLYKGEKTILAGTVVDGNTGNALAHAKIKLPNGSEYVANENGKFSITKFELYNPINVMITAEGYGTQAYYVNDYSDNLNIPIYKYSIHQLRKSSRRFEENEMGVIEDGMVMLAPAAVNEGMIVESVAKIKGIKQVPAMEAKPAKQVSNKVNDVKKEGKFQNKIAMDEKDIFQHDINNGAGKNLEQVSQHKYYRARVFYAPNYENQEAVEERTDFRNTIYWNPNVEIGYSGRKTIEFFASDDITSFRTTVEGITNDGNIGRIEKTFFTQLPFEMRLKIPLEVVTEDQLSIPLTLKNNTNGPLGGILKINSPQGLKVIGNIDSVQTIMPGKAKTVYLNYKVLDKIGEENFNISFHACALSDAFSQKIKIVAKGFPVQASFSSQDIEKEYSFELNNVVRGSLRASFTAFPNVVNDLMKGVEGILSEPYGCFEQTSCTAYPNAMVLDYLKNTESKDSKTLTRATELLDKGYKRLTSFETPNKGYEWFGASPAHEGLTAYGIMEFVDMKKAGQHIDQQMLDRTVQWLLNHKDGKGGFERERRALHDFGRISDEVLNGYIVYALAEAGYKDIENEFEATYKTAIQSKDAYLIAMTCNAAYCLNNLKKANEALNILLSMQDKNGSITGSSHSITYSQGNSLVIETSALSLMAMLKSKQKNESAINSAVKFLVGSRSGSGVFSSTQGTILALKSLTEYAKYSKKATEDGTIEIYVDHKKVAEKSYKAGDKGEIKINDLEQFLKVEGKHKLKVIYKHVKNPLPYSLAVNWNTYLPASDNECQIDIKTSVSSQKVFVGETVRLSASLTNKSEKEVPSTMAVIGIPAGFTAQAWQLKELQEKNVFDYYEIKGNNIAIYYRGLAASAHKEINLDLKAELPGTYDAPASSAYLYYTNEFKTWTALPKIVVSVN